MNRLATTLAFLTLALAPLSHAATSEEGARWWKHIEVLASDEDAGRFPGTPGFEAAARYVETQFRSLGLQPAGVDGYRQPVAFDVQTIVPEQSSATLTGPAGAQQLQVGEEIIFGRQPQRTDIDAPLVFLGYGLHLPQAGYDEFAGLDLKGKVAVIIGGGPSDLSGNLKAHAHNDIFYRALARAGAVGVISIPLPSAMDFAWSRQMKFQARPAMSLADPSLRASPHAIFSASFNPEHAETLFTGSGHSLAEIIAKANAGQRLEGFNLAKRLKAHVAVKIDHITSPNLIAKLEGSDPTLRTQYVVVSAHLDHLGVGEPIAGQNIYRGAMDDASGVASVLEIARRLTAAPHKPRRSILFVIVTAEEQGLLGSRYFAHHPTVPQSEIVADLNFDMPLPLFPLKTLVLYGLDESTLADDARAVAAPLGIDVVRDPYPNRNAFTRTDLYSFVQVGIPAVAFRFGAPAGTPQEKMIRDWLSQRYHSPQDDLAQPVDLPAAADLVDLVTSMTLRVADAEKRPAFRADSPFRVVSE
ncbi:MAG: M20/M25/M40 family metallo-hydrolase [Caulobacteraceae bacterium]|nr:M20/M25/M40 family metallo-hydrolase [Caulobacteraceae bacterium]